MEYLNSNSLKKLPRSEPLALYQRVAPLLAKMPEGSVLNDVARREATKRSP